MPDFKRVTRHKSTRPETIIINMDLVRVLEGRENYTIVRFDDDHSLTISESAESLIG
jgi:hypothetical protein